jgi:NADPH-dependent ferric siderophore reductase
MANASQYAVVVKRTTRLTPNMQRLCLTGESLQSFPNTLPGAYIKLLFDTHGNPLTSELNDQEVAMRTYTVSAFDKDNGELTVDMVLHNDNGITGPASSWAASAQPGDALLIAGPGSSKALAPNYDWVLFAGDMTAMPTIKNYLASLPDNTKGYAVIAIEHEDDKQVLKKPIGVELVWALPSQLLCTLEACSWLVGMPAVWVACEFSEMRAIRRWLKDVKAVPHNQVYISSYWKKGRSEDQHKIDKRIDSEDFARLTE